MANSEKNIVIRPRTGESINNPVIEFVGADSSTAGQTITAEVTPVNQGTITFIGASGTILTLSDNATNKFDVNGNTRINGNLTVTGSTTISGATTFDTDIVPDTDNTGNVGTALLTWNNGRFTNLTVDSTITTANLFPGTNNTGNVGNSAFTWNNGFFTNLTIEGVLSVREALDLGDFDILRFGNTDDWEFFHNGTDNYMDLNVGDLIIRDNVTTRFTFGRTTGSLTLSGDLDVNGGDITTSAATFNLVATATTVNAYGAATTLGIGNTATAAQTVNMFTASTGASTYNIATGATATATTKTLNIGTGGAAGSTTNVNIGSSIAGTTTVNSGTLVGAATTQNVFNTVATTVNAFGVAATLSIGATTGTLTLNNPTIVGSQTTQTLFNTVATTVNFAGASTTLAIGNTATAAQTVNMFTASTGASTYNIATGATATATTKTLNIGTGGAAGSTTNVNIGSSVGGTLTVNNGTIVGALTTQNVFNTIATTVNAFGAATTLAIGATTGTTTVRNNLTVSGDLTVSGTTTTINTETLTLADNIIILNSNETAAPTQNAGIEIERGTSANVSLIWDETTDRWTVGAETFVANTFIGAVTGNASTATTLQTARNINGVAFNGSADITITSASPNALTISTGLSGTSYNGSAAVTIALATGYGDTLNPYASKTANFVLAAPSGAAGVPTFRAIVAADIPTLNQSTTGSAATLTTSRALWGQNFNGGAAVTGNLTSVGNITGTGAVTLTATTGTLGLAATGANIITATTNAVERLRIDSAGNTGIGTISPGVRLHVQSEDAGTNTVLDVLRLDRQSTGVPAIGIGVGLEFAVETSAANTEIGGIIEAVTTSVTAAAESFDLVFRTMAAGAAAAERARISSNGTLTVTGNIVPEANNTRNIGSASLLYNTMYATLFSGTAVEAYYADLAENYEADQLYEPGTVLIFGGEKELTTTTTANNFRVAGVVSTEPATLMNSKLEGDTVVPLALQGRVPCMVIGRVEKGDMIVTSGISGYGMVNNNPAMGTVIGKAVGTKLDTARGWVEVVVGRV